MFEEAFWHTQQFIDEAILATQTRLKFFHLSSKDIGRA